MMKRAVGWSEEDLAHRSDVFEALVAKDIKLSVRTLTASLHGVITAAGAGEPARATAPPVPVLSPIPTQSTPTIPSTDMALVLATWNGYVDTELYPYLVDTFVQAAHHTATATGRALDVTLTSLTEDYAVEYLSYAVNRLKNIGDVVWTALQTQLTQGYQAGESIAQLATRVSQTAGVATPRALTIARTEVISAANAGSLQQILSAGFNSDDCKKEWLATEDTRTREAHRLANGQTTPLGEPFMVGGEALLFPGDPTGSPGNVINCRCSMAYAFADDAADALQSDLVAASSAPVMITPMLSDMTPVSALDEALVATSTWTAEDEKLHPRDNDGKFAKKPGSGLLHDLESLIGKTPIHLNTKVIYTNKYDHNTVIARKKLKDDAFAELTWNAQLKKFVIQTHTQSGNNPPPIIMGKGEAYKNLHNNLDWYVPGKEKGLTAPQAPKPLAPPKKTPQEILATAPKKAPGPKVSVPKQSEMEPASPAPSSLPEDISIKSWMFNKAYPDGTVVAQSTAMSPSGVQTFKRIVYDASKDKYDIQFRHTAAQAWMSAGVLSGKDMYSVVYDQSDWVATAAVFRHVSEEDLPDVADLPNVQIGVDVTPTEALFHKVYPHNTVVATSTINNLNGKGTTTRELRYNGFNGNFVMSYKTNNGAWHKAASLTPDNAWATVDYDNTWVMTHEAVNAPSSPSVNAPGVNVPNVNAPSVPSVPQGKKPDIPFTDSIDTSDFKFTGKTVGTHGAEIWVDSKDGKKYLFKGNPGAPYATEADLATNQLHEMLGLPTPKTYVVKLDGQQGSLQEIIDGPDAWPGAFNAANTPPHILKALQREQVFDWLVGNHDAHKANFIKGGSHEGQLYGIDKGQAFKFYNLDKLDFNFHPNEHPPVYNLMWKAFINGHIDFTDLKNPSDKHTPVGKLIADIQAIPDDTFRELFRPYAEKAKKAGVLGTFGGGDKFSPNNVDSFLDALVVRKNNLKDDFAKLWSKAVIDRNAKMGIKHEVPNIPPTPVSTTLPEVIPSTPGGHVPVPDVTKFGQPVHLNTKVIYTNKYEHNAVIAGKTIAFNDDLGKLGMTGETRLVWNANTKKFVQQYKGENDTNWTDLKSYGKGEAYKKFSSQGGWKTVISAPLNTPTGGNLVAPGGLRETDISGFSTADRIHLVGSKSTAGFALTNVNKTTDMGSYFNRLIMRLNELKAEGKYNVSALQLVAMVDEYRHGKEPGVYSAHYFRDALVTWLKNSNNHMTASEALAQYNFNDISKLGGLVGNKNAGAIQSLFGKADQLKNAKRKQLESIGNPASIGLPEKHTAGKVYKEISLPEMSTIHAQMQSDQPWTGSQIAGIKAYTGSAYNEMNSMLRNSQTEVTQSVLTRIKNTQAGMRPLTRDIKVWRGTDTKFMTGIGKATTYEEMQKTVGQVIRDKGFLSSSPIKGNAWSHKGVLYEIELPKGTPGAWVKPISQHPNENEFLIAAGTKFEILEVSKKDGHTVVHMRAVP